ncbi:hypothetical protein FRACYDRAFT_243756 [Fragilariopsis cylindrus CCMP1102]|uniref:G-protein coupled receptors family 1 profile domain-containing protein n=1 Tax=Fragilariopsis cylindrus CCMP1102 TaxID=635003 RepID=A0A1E7F2Z4_9STRA|nr:hypothetical protein FRACYDRAFT_243756 [Fragilariopsis cylindrus CCMP1102]|eukprot:OEU12506.1 hypothetical protein FRACYDRAFT_243756 [Fragilariopsis cylindrus CCMP1102]
MICSHGYIPRIVETEPTIKSTFRLGAFPKIQKTENWGTDIDKLVTYQYYTCCPPDVPLDNITINRHCTNSSSIFDANKNLEDGHLHDHSLMTCENENKPYLRQMENYGARESIVCCDFNIDDQSTLNNNITTNDDFLDVTECVPFRNEKYMPSWSGDIYGRIFPISCNNKDIYSDFQFPTLVENTNPYGIQYYECCKTAGSTKTLPFIHNSQFKLTVYPQIAISAIAVLSSLLLITALLIPLWLHIVGEHYESKNEKNTSTNSSTSHSSNMQISSSNGNNSRPTLTRNTSLGCSNSRRSLRLQGSISSNGNSRPTLTRNTSIGCSYRRSSLRLQGSVQLQPRFSGYNLYLVYLAIPDMILNIFLLGMYSSYVDQKYNPIFSGVITVDESNNPFSGAFVVACSTANLYLNCVISYEVLILVRNSFNATQCDPPSLWKVTLQSVLVYVFGILVFTIHYFIGYAQRFSFEKGHFERSISLNNLNFYWSLVVTYIFPVLFFSYVWITVWYRGYMPSATGRMKQLVWYFLRIFVVFYVIWLPGMCLLVVGAAKHYEYANLICIGYLFCGIQPIVSTCMAMTKSDIRQYTQNVITLSYLRKSRQSR